jgi:TPR repeat protein
MKKMLMKIINLFFLIFFLFSITPTFSMEGEERFEYEKNFQFNPNNRDAKDLCSLGMNHKYGWGGVTKDIKKSINCYQKAAEQGYAPAQYELGLIYACGTNVNQDDVESVKWTRLSAEQGYAPAQKWLGNCYCAGRGVTKDAMKGIKWIRRSADQGYAEAQYELGFAYGECFYNLPDMPTFLPRDEVEAVKWYRLAAAQGHEEAKRNLDYREKQLVHEEKMSLLREKRRHMNAENVMLLETSAVVGGCCNIF